MSDYLTTNDAAKVIKRAPATVLYYERICRLKSQRTESGMRIFLRSDVERLAQELEARKHPSQSSSVAR